MKLSIFAATLFASVPALSAPVDLAANGTHNFDVVVAAHSEFEIRNDVGSVVYKLNTSGDNQLHITAKAGPKAGGHVDLTEIDGVISLSITGDETYKGSADLPGGIQITDNGGVRITSITAGSVSVINGVVTIDGVTLNEGPRIDIEVSAPANVLEQLSVKAAQNLKIIGGKGLHLAAKADLHARDHIECTDACLATKMDIQVTSAEVFVRGLIVPHLGIKTSSGDVEVSRSMLGELRVSSSSGRLNIERNSGDIDARTSSGDVTLSENQTVELNVKTSSGVVALEKAVGAIAVETSSGDIKGGDLGDRAALTTKSGRVKVRVGRGGLIIESISGDIQVSSHTGDIRAESRSGSITFDNPDATSESAQSRTGRVRGLQPEKISSAPKSVSPKAPVDPMHMTKPEIVGAVLGGLAAANPPKKISDAAVEVALAEMVSLLPQEIAKNPGELKRVRETLAQVKPVVDLRPRAVAERKSFFGSLVSSLKSALKISDHADAESFSKSPASEQASICKDAFRAH